MLVPNRYGSSKSYRYGFQGQEKDNELKGEGNSLNYTFRMHDPRVGRFFAIDPLTHKYPWYSPYQFSGNKVIQFVELEGAEESSPSYMADDTDFISMVMDPVKDGIRNCVWLPVLRLCQSDDEEGAQIREGLIKLGYNQATFANFTNKELADKLDIVSHSGGFSGIIPEDSAGKRFLRFLSDAIDIAAVVPTKGSGVFMAVKDSGLTLKALKSVLTEAKIIGKLEFGKCKEFAKDFKKQFGGQKFQINAPNNAGMSVLVEGKDVPLSTTGMHQFVQKTINGLEYIFDNMNPNGVLKSDYIKGLEAFDSKTRRIISGEEIMKTATEIK